MTSLLVAKETLKVLKLALCLNFYGLKLENYTVKVLFLIYFYLIDIMNIFTNFQKILYIRFRATLN